MLYLSSIFLLYIYLLHAEVSYMIDTTCNWTFFFFPILPVLATFWNAKTPIFFFIFQLPIFVEPYRQTYVHQCWALILKHPISPYSGIVWVLFYNI